MAEDWTRRFHTPMRHTVRPARGDVDVAAVVTVDAAGLKLELWHPQEDELTRPKHVPDGDLLNSVLTVDGRALLRLRDVTGDEMGHVFLAALDGTSDRDLTPDHPAYTLRGIDTSADGRFALLTTASAAGFEVLRIDLTSFEVVSLMHSEHETWNGRISADGSLVAVDTTDHTPGKRRFAVTVVDGGDGGGRDGGGRGRARLYDEPAGTARVVTFSRRPGDSRLLAASEKSGFTRPTIWDPIGGQRHDYDLPELSGEVVPLDWSPDASRILAAHVDDGVHQLLELNVADGTVTPLSTPPGSVFRPDIATSQMFVVASHYSPDCAIRITRERYNTPMEVWEHRGGTSELALPGAGQDGEAFRSHMVTAADGMRSQLWVGSPPGHSGPRPTVIEVHGGPTYLTADHFDPAAQAWLDEGFAFASLNYRGSVTFGRDFREAFLGRVGQGELDDIRAAVQWLIDSGTADPEAIFITGESYGGYLTLMSLARLPDLFRGGFAFIAMADWALSYEDSNPALQKALTWFFGGTPDEVPEKLAAASVTTYADAIRAPLWIKNGRHDTRTPLRQITAFTDLLHARGADVVVELFDGGHQTITTDSLVQDQRTMIDLARAALAGRRWSENDRSSAR